MVTLACAGLYFGALAVLASFSALEASLLFRANRQGLRPITPPWPMPTRWPVVTVQLTMCDEQHLIAGAVRSVFALEYPTSQVQLQLCDDSASPECIAEVERLCQLGRANGRWVEHLRRSDRRGFTAGNLNHARSTAAGELVAIIDVDFRLAPDFLIKTVPWLLNDPSLAAVQTHWEHSNRDETLLTQAADAAFDAHLHLEQPTRAALGLPNFFTGSSGLWRTAAIDSLGGWSEDTGTQDLDLSLRAQAAGWRIQFTNETVSTARLPSQLGALLAQQARWAHASGALLRRHWWRRPGDDRPWSTRVIGLAHLAIYACAVATTVILALTWPLAALLPSHSWEQPVTTFVLLTIIFFNGAKLDQAIAQRKGRATPAQRLAQAALGLMQSALTAHTAVAFLTGLVGRPLRTWLPSNTRAGSKATGALIFSALIALLGIVGAITALLRQQWFLVLPVALFVPGLIVLLLDPARLPAFSVLTRKRTFSLEETPQ